MEDDAVKALTPAAKAHEGVYTIGSEAERHAIGNKGVKQKGVATEEEEAWRFMRDTFLSRNVEYKIQRFEHEAAIVLHCFSLIQKEE